MVEWCVVEFCFVDIVCLVVIVIGVDGEVFVVF